MEEKRRCLTQADVEFLTGIMHQLNGWNKDKDLSVSISSACGPYKGQCSAHLASYSSVTEDGCEFDRYLNLTEFPNGENMVNGFDSNEDDMFRGSFSEYPIIKEGGE